MAKLVDVRTAATYYRDLNLDFFNSFLTKWMANLKQNFCLAFLGTLLFHQAHAASGSSLEQGNDNLSQSLHARCHLQGKFLLSTVLLSGIVGAVVVLTCMVFLLKKKAHLSCSSWSENEEKRRFTTSLMGQSFRSQEACHEYKSLCFWMAPGRIWKPHSRKGQRLEAVLGVLPRRFFFSELYDATGGFCESNLIGVGGSSMVYRGKLKDERLVAVKRLNFLTGPAIQQEFLLEVELLSRLHHFHIVPLLGYCSEIRGKEIHRILVYDFMAKGNLREHLSRAGSRTLNWNIRMQIAIGSARGLEYLHEFAYPKVLHCDFKSQNILLDRKWRAKVADFGMAEAVKSKNFYERSSLPSQMSGTFGYLAPEYVATGRATRKSDVFSFGVVLLELLSGRPSLDMSSPIGEQSLVQWAVPMLLDRQWIMNNLLDPELRHSSMPEKVQKLAFIVWSCLQADPELRPSMTSVVQALMRLSSKTVVDQATDILPSSNDQIFRRKCSIKYEECYEHGFLDISIARSKIDMYPSKLVLDEANGGKVVDSSSFDKDMSRKHEWQRCTTLEKSSSTTLEKSLKLSPMGRELCSETMLRSGPVKSLEEEMLDLFNPCLEYLQLCEHERVAQSQFCAKTRLLMSNGAHKRRDAT